MVNVAQPPQIQIGQESSQFRLSRSRSRVEMLPSKEKVGKNVLGNVLENQKFDCLIMKRTKSQGEKPTNVPKAVVSRTISSPAVSETAAKPTSRTPPSAADSEADAPPPRNDQSLQKAQSSDAENVPELPPKEKRTKSPLLASSVSNKTGDSASEDSPPSLPPKTRVYTKNEQDTDEDDLAIDFSSDEGEDSNEEGPSDNSLNTLRRRDAKKKRGKIRRNHYDYDFVPSLRDKLRGDLLLMYSVDTIVKDFIRFYPLLCDNLKNKNGIQTNFNLNKLDEFVPQSLDSPDNFGKKRESLFSKFTECHRRSKAISSLQADRADANQDDFRSSSWSKSFPSALSHMHTMTMKVVSAGKAEASILSKDVVVYTKWKTWNSDPKVFGSPSFVCPGTEPKSSTSIQSATVSSAISNFYFSPSTKKEEKLETNFDADIILDNEEQIIFGAGYIIREVIEHPPEPDTLQLPDYIRVEIGISLYSTRPVEEKHNWKILASEIGLKRRTVTFIDRILQNQKTPGFQTCAEVVLRHWQYMYNNYRHSKELCPKYPCTQDGLLCVLKAIERYDLINYLNTALKRQ